MDRIIRKQLKSNPSPPLVPPSEWNHLDDEVKESDEKKIVTPVKKEDPPKRLIEVIEEKSGEVWTKDLEVNPLSMKRLSMKRLSMNLLSVKPPTALTANRHIPRCFW